MDQISENPPLTLEEIEGDPEEARSRGAAWPLIAVVGALCVCAVILLWPTGSSLVSRVGGTLPSSSTNEAAQQKTIAQHQPLAYYHEAISGGLFSAPQLAAPETERIPPKPPARRSALPARQMPAVPDNPYADWAYAGAVKRGDRIMALLENTKSKEGQYVVAGDSFQDAQVENITDQQVILKAAGKRYTIPKSEAISVIALDKNAPYLANGNSPGGQPGAAPPPPPVPGGPPAQIQPQASSNSPAEADTNADQDTQSADQ